MPGAGRLARQITITQETVAGRTALNEVVKGAPVTITRQAQRTDASDGERFAAGQTGAFVMARFVIRSDPETVTIKPKDILTTTDDGGTWNIVGIKETDRVFLEITATRNLDR